mgnify:FL=1
MVDLHPVKSETFLVPERINIDPKGFKRAVDTYTETDFGLYMARGADHPDFGYLESWLLPELNLRVSIFHFRDKDKSDSSTSGTTRSDYYVDIVDIAVDTANDTSTWHTRDLYVDLSCVMGEPVDVLDIDELAASTSAGIITADEAERAIEATLTAVDGITRHGDNILECLAAQGYPLTWADNVPLTSPMST